MDALLPSANQVIIIDHVHAAITPETTPPDVPKEGAPPWLHRFQDMILRFTTAVLRVVLTNHPVFEMLEEQQLGRNVLVLAIPMVILLITMYNLSKYFQFMRLTAVFLSLGVVLIVNGILLRKTIHGRISNLIEILGISLIFASYFTFAVCLLPGFWSLVPAVSFILSLLPFAIAYSSKCREGSNDPDHHQLLEAETAVQINIICPSSGSPEDKEKSEPH